VKFKGTFIVDLVRIIRSQKNIDWSKYLKPEDFEIVEGLILPSNWYPSDSYWRLSQAVTTEVAKMQLDMVFEFGRLNAKSSLKVYKRWLVQGDPLASLENCSKLMNSFYDFEGTEHKNNIIENGPGWIKLTVYDFPDIIIPEMRVPYFYGMAGYYQEIAEVAGGKTIKNTLLDKGNCFEMTFSWGEDKSGGSP